MKAIIIFHPWLISIDSDPYGNFILFNWDNHCSYSYFLTDLYCCLAIYFEFALKKALL